MCLAASRSRRVYDATVTHTLGARLSMLRRVLYWEYAVMALVTAGFAVLTGSALATGLLRWRLDIDPSGLYWSGLLIALGVSGASLGMGRPAPHTGHRWGSVVAIRSREKLSHCNG